MANRLSKGKAGGGLGSKNVVRPGVRGGQRPQAANPRGVAQIGTQRGNHATGSNRPISGDQEPLYAGRAPIGVPLGNSLTTNVGKGGPGAGRTLYGQSGTQSCHGAAAQGVNVGSGPSKQTGRPIDR